MRHPGRVLGEEDEAGILSTAESNQMTEKHVSRRGRGRKEAWAGEKHALEAAELPQDFMNTSFPYMCC